MLSRRHVHLISGASGSGKTTILLQALSAWEKGEDFPIQFDAKSCAYILADRAFDITIQRAERIGIKRVEFYSLLDDDSFDEAWFDYPTKAFKEVVSRFKNPFDLLIIDPIMPFMEGSMNDYKAVMKTLSKLGKRAKQQGLTIIAAHHASKARTDYTFCRTQDRTAGTMAWSGFSTDQIFISTPEELGKDWHELLVASRRAAPFSLQMRMDENGWFIPVERIIAEVGKLGNAFLKDGGGRKELLEFAARLGISQSTAYRQRKKAIEAGLLKKDGSGKYVLAE